MAEKDDSSPASELSNLSISEDLVPIIPQKQSQTVDLDFDGVLQPPLLLQTNEKQCGGQLWPGGLVLAKFLLQHKTDVLAGKTIVELGAGSGLVSLAIALGLRRTGISNTLHITDGLIVLLPLIKKNISLNKDEIRNTTVVLPTQLKWGEPLPNGVPPNPDILLAADCCYIEASFPLLLDTMKALIGKETICFFCYKRRRRADKEMISLLMKEFAVVEVEGEWQRERMFVYEISRKRTPKSVDLASRD